MPDDLKKFIDAFSAALEKEQVRIWHMEDENDSAISGALRCVRSALDSTIAALEQ